MQAVHTVQSQNLLLIMGIVIVASSGVIVANLMVDILCAVLDLSGSADESRQRGTSWLQASLLRVPTGEYGRYVGHAGKLNYRPRKDLQ
jgi:hypothetical protein